MSGWEEARDWLAKHGAGWTIGMAKSTLQAGIEVGSPTTLHVTVSLRRTDDEDVFLTGEGPSFLEAVQTAIGALE